MLILIATAPHHLHVKYDKHLLFILIFIILHFFIIYLYSFILDKYPTITPASLLWKNNSYLPLRASSSHDEFQGYAQSILDIFTINLYDLNAKITALPTLQTSTPVKSSSFLSSFLSSSSSSSSLQSPPPSSSPPSSSSSSPQPSSSIYKIEVTAPANLWSLQVLLQRNDQPTNDFEMKVLRCLADRCHLQLDVLSMEVINQINLSYLVRVT